MKLLTRLALVTMFMVALDPNGDGPPMWAQIIATQLFILLLFIHEDLK